MRILLTTETFENVWTFTRALSEELLSRGHQIALVSFGKRPSHEQQAWVSAQTSGYGRSFQFVASSAPLEWMENNEFVLTQGAGALHHVAREFEPDLLHSTQFCYGALTLDVPRVITAHSDLFSWMETCRGCKPELTRWFRQYRALVTHGLSNADAVVSPTRWMAGSLTKHFEKLAPSYMIRDGRSLSYAARPCLRTLQAVTAGRLWDETKGIRLLQDVLSPMPMYVAGERRHHNSVSPKQLGKAILLGALPELSLHALYERSALYIDMSVYDPSGLDALDAALCGCAVLANDLPTTREIWGDAALYFRGARELSALLHQLNRNGQELAEMQQRAYRHAMTLTPQRMADGYEAIYEALTAGRFMPASTNEDRHYPAHAA